jgi:hypothetical protein
VHVGLAQGWAGRQFQDYSVMADTNIQESARIVRAWEATAKPGDLPSLDVHAHALKIQEYRRAQGVGNSPPRVDAFDKFQRLERLDSPPQMPAWRDPRPELPERRWRNPRGAA